MLAYAADFITTLLTIDYANYNAKLVGREGSEGKIVRGGSVMLPCVIFIRVIGTVRPRSHTDISDTHRRQMEGRDMRNEGWALTPFIGRHERILLGQERRGNLWWRWEQQLHFFIFDVCSARGGTSFLFSFPLWVVRL